jgi:hypothetical protein
MSDTSPLAGVNDAVVAATTAGIAAIDAARIAGVPLPACYGDRAARTTEYYVRWLGDGEASGFDPLSGRVVWGYPGWYVSRYDGRPVPSVVSGALHALVRATQVSADGTVR